VRAETARTVFALIGSPYNPLFHRGCPCSDLRGLRNTPLT